MPENGRYFDLTEDLRLIKGRPVAVSGNMAAMLRASRYAPHFEVRGDRTHHVGAFDQGAAQEALELARGKRRIGLAELEQACRDLGIEPFDQRVHDKELLRSAPELATCLLYTSRCV